MQDIKPMVAVAALYSPDQHDLAEAIVASLSSAIFHESKIKPANKGKIFVGYVSQKVVKWSTKSKKSLDDSGNV